MKDTNLNIEKPALAAFDLDGTLLTSEHLLTDLTVRAIGKLEAAGVCVVISTGRSYEGMAHYARQLGLKTPIICYNGAMIADGADGRVLHEWLLPDDIAREALAYARQRDIHFQVFRNGELWYEKEREESAYYKASTGLDGRVGRLDEWEVLEPTKALMILPPSRQPAEFPELHEAREYFSNRYGQRLYCALSKPFYLEFINGKGSKGNALSQVADDLGIGADRVAAFGDGFNDLEMLEYAGLSVAMANAPEGVREKCRLVTPLSNDEDGVADFIERYFL